METLSEILNKHELSKSDIIRLLSITNKSEQDELLSKAYLIKEKTIGRNVYLRGLIEFSNLCRKNCLYCGIRTGNTKVTRYSLTDDEIIKVTEFARNNQFTSIVLQSGEQNNSDFTKRITGLITSIKKITDPDFRITQ